MKITHLQYLPCKCSWSHSDQITSQQICCNGDKTCQVSYIPGSALIHPLILSLESHKHFLEIHNTKIYTESLSYKNWRQWHCELPIPCLCFEEKPLIFPGYRPDGPELMVMITYIGHMAFWACNTNSTPLFKAKTAPHFWERLTGRRLAICAHFLLQPIDLLTDLKINSKLIYSALYRVIY